jgi:hypothetical protein
MNSDPKPIAGTYVLSGLIQGKVVIEPDMLNIWTKEALKKGFHFALRIDANDFSLLPSETARSVSKLGNTSLEEVVCEHVSSLIGLFDSPSAAQIFSTLRSEEFKFGKSKQTIYKILPDGRVEPESRTIELETKDPPAELTSGGKLKLTLISLSALALLFILSLPFIDYKVMFDEAKDKVTTLKANEITVDTTKLSEAIEVTVKEIVTKDKSIVLLVKKGKRWETLFDSSPKTTFDNWSDFNTAQALHSRLRCEWRDKHGNLLMVNYINVSDLKTKDSVEKKILISTKYKIATLRIVPD